MLDSMAEAIRSQQTRGKISGWIGQEADDRLLRMYDRRHWPQTLQSNMGVYVRPEWDFYTGLVIDKCEVLLPASDTAIGQYLRRGFRFGGYAHPDALPSDVIESYRKYAPTVLRESLDAYEARMRHAEVLRQQALAKQMAEAAQAALEAEAVAQAAPVEPVEPVFQPVETVMRPAPLQNPNFDPFEVEEGDVKVSDEAEFEDNRPDINTLESFLPKDFKKPKE